MHTTITVASVEIAVEVVAAGITMTIANPVHIWTTGIHARIRGARAAATLIFLAVSDITEAAPYPLFLRFHSIADRARGDIRYAGNLIARTFVGERALAHEGVDLPLSALLAHAVAIVEFYGLLMKP
jgi:hypothetical protein